MRRYIITGTPSAGKSTIVRELESHHYAVIHEAATDIIKAEHKKGHLEPWHQKSYFIDKIVDLQKKRQEHEVSQNEFKVQFFDRSPVCTYALCLYMDYEPPIKLLNEIQRILKDKVYEKKVFFVENLGFCERNEIRKIDFNECLKFEKLHKKAYKKFDFELCYIKRGPVDERMKSIITQV